MIEYTPYIRQLPPYNPNNSVKNWWREAFENHIDLKELLYDNAMSVYYRQFFIKLVDSEDLSI